MQYNCSAEVFRKEKGLEFVFQGRESSRVTDVFGDVAPDVRTEVGQKAKAMSFAVEALEFEHACL